MGTVATSGDTIIQVHRALANGAREAAEGLPTVVSAGMREGHAALLEGAIADTRKVLGALARVADLGAEGAEALAGQDHENGQKFGGVQGVRR
ncbi:MULTISPECIES: hypothetical protein [Mycobacteroides]|uniref:hypothetical protein n=1 Tax=Mycobacteroides TaxID=670516 RepID=UPI0009928210|nr:MULTISPECIES: hypothetical protein [Mycobacteroides]MDQ8118542.1 hypothetical protein [Mycobacteroides abscessus subsp. massiliense]ORA57314.1 hypothetical protein BST24_24290 [Mycobacteroides franklinii]